MTIANILVVTSRSRSYACNVSIASNCYEVQYYDVFPTLTINLCQYIFSDLLCRDFSLQIKKSVFFTRVLLRITYLFTD